jgi:hypothetical protein
VGKISVLFFWLIVTNVSKGNIVSVVHPEDGGDMLPRNVDNHPQE